MVQHINVTLTVKSDAQVWGIVEPEYVSYTMDWWSNTPKHPSWGNSSVLNADLSSPPLVEAAKGLSPAFLRIGGSQADTIIYKVHGDEEPCIPEHCLTMKRWNAILQFAQKVGARIVFTLNYLSHTTTIVNKKAEKDQRDWDPSNTRGFLNYTSQHAPDGLIYGFELGNELLHGKKAKNITRMTTAYQDLRGLISEFWKPPLQQIPIILGPASGGGSEMKKLVKPLTPYLDVFTYHKYFGRGGDEHLGDYAIQPRFFTHPFQFVDRAKPVHEEFKKSDNKPSRLWIGEGAMAYNSGRHDVTDSFVGALWYTNLLGTLAKSRPIPHGVLCRQALTGGYYELISHETLQPNPDYWIAYLWTKLVGNAPVGPMELLKPTRFTQNWGYTFGCCKQPGKDTLLVHSFCAAQPSSGYHDNNKNKIQTDDLTLVLINIDGKKTYSVKIPLGRKGSVYTIIANAGASPSKKDILKSRKVRINDKPVLTGIDGSFPGLIPKYISDTQKHPVDVPPYSISFVVVHGAGIKACQKANNEKSSSASTIKPADSLGKGAPLDTAHHSSNSLEKSYGKPEKSKEDQISLLPGFYQVNERDRNDGSSGSSKTTSTAFEVDSNIANHTEQHVEIGSYSASIFNQEADILQIIGIVGLIISVFFVRGRVRRHSTGGNTVLR